VNGIVHDDWAGGVLMSGVTGVDAAVDDDDDDVDGADMLKGERQNNRSADLAI